MYTCTCMHKYVYVGLHMHACICSCIHVYVVVCMQWCSSHTFLNIYSIFLHLHALDVKYCRRYLYCQTSSPLLVETNDPNVTSEDFLTCFLWNMLEVEDLLWNIFTLARKTSVIVAMIVTKSERYFISKWTHILIYRILSTLYFPWSVLVATIY